MVFYITKLDVTIVRNVPNTHKMENTIDHEHFQSLLICNNFIIFLESLFSYNITICIYLIHLLLSYIDKMLIQAFSDKLDRNI
jgi:hypothetical protein